LDIVALETEVLDGLVEVAVDKVDKREGSAKDAVETAELIVIGIVKLFSERFKEGVIYTAISVGPGRYS
jgi:hypothetical protein